MMQNFEQWVLNIVTLSIFIVIFEILIPSGKIKKYVNMVSGFILIIAIINPLISFFAKGVDINDIAVNTQVELDIKEIENNSKLLTQERNKQIIDEYRKRLILEIEKMVEDVVADKKIDVDVIINENYESDSFGEIITVYIYLSEIDNIHSIKPVSSIKEVVINQDLKTIGNDTYSSNINFEKEVDKKIKSNIEKKISSVFEVPVTNIIVGMKR